MKPQLPTSYIQHGFMKEHSTTTLLTNLIQHILDGLNQNPPPKRTLLAMIDINKAFDTMPKHILQQKILNTTLHTNDKKWLTNFLLDRRAQTLCNNTNSSKQSPSFKQTPPLLGVTYDAHMPFSQHTKNITTKATKRLKALKTLTSFDQQKESLTILYKTTLNYASPSWCPSFSNQIGKLFN